MIREIPDASRRHRITQNPQPVAPCGPERSKAFDAMYLSDSFFAGSRLVVAYKTQRTSFLSHYKINLCIGKERYR